MSTSPTTALVSDATSTVFTNLLGFLTTKAAPAVIQNSLTTASVPDDVATMITNAITQGDQVTLSSFASYNLGDLLAPFLPSAVTVPTQWTKIVLTSLTFTADPANQTLAMDAGVSIPVSMGKTTSVPCTCELKLDGAASPPAFTAGLTGTVLLPNSQAPNSQLQLTFDLTQASQSIDLEWVANAGDDYLQLSDLASLFDGALPDLPDGVDFKLTKATAELDLSSTDDSLELSAVSDTGAAFILIDYLDASGDQGDGSSGQGSGSWELACGAALTADPTAWPCISTDVNDLDLTFDAAELLLATADFPNFEWPAVDETQKSIFDAFPFDLDQGIAIVAILDLTDAADGTVAKNLLGLASSRTSPPKDHSGTAQPGQILLSAQLQTSTVELKATFGSCTVLKYPIDLSLSITFTDDLPAFTAAGNITFTNWNNIEASAGLTITDDAIQGDINFTAPPPYALLSGKNLLAGLTINELAGMMGIDFENQELTLGFVGNFALGSISNATSQPSASTLNSITSPSTTTTTTPPPKQLPQPNAGELALIVGVNVDADGIPIFDVDFFLLRLTQVDLGKVIQTVYPSVSSDAVTALTGIQLDDILLYWCDVPTGTYVLPDGTVPATGFKIHGQLDLCNFNVWGELEVDATDGAQGSLFFSKITLGDVLLITGDAPPANTVPSTFTAGGPWVSVSTDGPTFLAGSWNVQVLDAPAADVEVTFGDPSLSFSIAVTDTEKFKDAFTCTLTTDSGQTSLQLGVNGNLTGDVSLPAIGNVPSLTLYLATTYSVTLSVALSNGTPTFSVSGSFKIGQEDINLSNVTIDTAITCFDDIPGAILNVITNNLSNLSNTAVSDAVNDAENLIKEEATNYWNDVKAAVGDVESLLLHLHHAHNNSSSSWPTVGDLVWGDGTAIYQIAQDGDLYVRRHVPDTPTYDDLTGRLQKPFPTYPYSQDIQGSQLMLDSLPIDYREVPSRIDGTIILDNDNSGYLYLIAGSPKIGNTPGMPGKYQIADTVTFRSLVNSSPQICFASDIKQIPNNKLLSKWCTISGGEAEQDAFVDGIRYQIPDQYTWTCLQRDFQKAQILDNTTFQAIPSGQELAQVYEGHIVECSPNYYLLQKSQLRLIQCMNSVEAYERFYGLGNYQRDNITDLQESIMNHGDSMPISPPGMKITC